MHTLDETDLAILQHLLVDARRPYSDIAAAVGVSAPTVSDRINRLTELGVIERFTLDLDWSRLTDGVPVLVDLHVHHDFVEAVAADLRAADGVERVFVTADAHVVVQGTLPKGAIREMVSASGENRAIRDYDVRLLVDATRTAALPGDVSVTLECDECGTTTSSGKSLHLDGELYQFCCDACRARFEDRYRRLRDEG